MQAASLGRACSTSRGLVRRVGEEQAIFGRRLSGRDNREVRQDKEADEADVSGTSDSILPEARIPVVSLSSLLSTAQPRGWYTIRTFAMYTSIAASSAGSRFPFLWFRVGSGIRATPDPCTRIGYQHTIRSKDYNHATKTLSLQLLTTISETCKTAVCASALCCRCSFGSNNLD
jgi:hypothetical protein